MSFSNMKYKYILCGRASVGITWDDVTTVGTIKTLKLQLLVK